MSLIDWLDILNRPILHKNDEQEEVHHTPSGMLEQCPDDMNCVKWTAELLHNLNSYECTRFQVWTNKAGQILGFSGLMLPLLSLVSQFIYKYPKQGIAIYLVSTFTLLATAFLFLAGWNAIRSLRPKIICTIDVDKFARKDSNNLEKNLWNYYCQELAAYKNNIALVNNKATEVNIAQEYFFYGFGCIAILMGFFIYTFI